MVICKHCNLEYKGKSFKNHQSNCSSNPNRTRKYGKSTKPAWNKGLTKHTDERVASYGRTTSSTAHLRTPSGCCAWSSEQRSAQAKKHGLGGYQPLAGRSKKFWVDDSFGKNVCLQSSYEYEMSLILNELEIKWIRPKALFYGSKRYFPDFYLVDYDIYLDPKNNYKAKLDEEKIHLVKEQNNVKLFIVLQEQLTKEWVLSIL